MHLFVGFSVGRLTSASALFEHTYRGISEQ